MREALYPQVEMSGFGGGLGFASYDEYGFT